MYLLEYFLRYFILFIAIGLIIYFAAIRPFLIKRARINWLIKESDRWVKIRTITEEEKLKITELYKPKIAPPKKERSPVKTLQIVGGILLGIGAILFVAANWNKAGDLFWIVALSLATITILFLGYYFCYNKRNYPVLGKNLMLIASFLWGADLFLTFQAFNVSITNNWLMILLWAFSIVPVYFFFDVTPVFYLSSVLFLISHLLLNSNYYFQERFLYSNFHSFLYPLIVFFILFPIAKGEKAKINMNIGALIFASILTIFVRGTSIYLPIFVTVGFTIFYYIKKESSYIVLASVVALLVALQVPYEYGIGLFYLSLLALILSLNLYLTYKLRIKTSLVFNAITITVCLLKLSNLILLKFYETMLRFEEIMLFLLLFSIIIYLLGLFHKRIASYFSNVYRIVGFLMSIFPLFYLSFYGSCSLMIVKNHFHFGLLYYLIGICIILLLYNFFSKNFEFDSSKLEIIPISVILLGVFLLIKRGDLILLNTIIMNSSLLLLSIFSMVYGFQKESLMIFNTGVIIFSSFVVIRYFDTLWKLMDRSIFFIIGGLIILATGFFLENKIKVLKRKIKDEKE
jgi:uncharacterized membrane protein